MFLFTVNQDMIAGCYLWLFLRALLISDLVFDQNIELKVEVESLKKELEEKQQLLDKTL